MKHAQLLDNAIHQTLDEFPCDDVRCIEEYSKEALAQIAVTFYVKGPIDDDYYYKLFEAAMRQGNIEALEILTECMYCYGDHPEYNIMMLVVAGIAANVETFKFIQHAFENYATHHPMKPIKVERLIENSEEFENDAVAEYLKGLEVKYIFPKWIDEE